jgi:hypothetical protein
MDLQYFGRSDKGKRDNNEEAFLAEKIATSVTGDLDPHADVIWCATISTSLEGIVTGMRQ